jgi:integrase
METEQPAGATIGATRRVLTDRTINSLKPAKAGQRYDVRDGVVPGLGVRVTDRGQKTFVLTTRYPGSENPTRRALGDVGALKLADARDKAREWLKLIKTGVDPKAIEEAQRQAEAEKRLASERAKQNTFAAVVEVFLEEYVQGRGMRQGKAVERRVRTELLPHWSDKPIQSITRDDVEDLIEKIVKRPAPRYAHNVLDDIKMMFGWCVDVVKRDRPYKLTASPTDRIKPTKLIGPKNIRTRVLDDTELKSLWMAGIKMGYPFGSLVQMLLLTGVRLTEASGAQHREFNGAWTIPAGRFKTGQEHRLPITKDMRILLDGLPRFNSGDFLFSASWGKTPLHGFSKAKARIDALMPDGIEPWNFHDIRRSVRTRLSGLQIPTRDKKSRVPIPDHVAEMVIGHGRKGLQRVYDQERYEPEICAALEAWQSLLRLIVDSKKNVVPLKRA